MNYDCFIICASSALMIEETENQKRVEIKHRRGKKEVVRKENGKKKAYEIN